MSRELQQQALSAACALGVSSSLGAPLGGVLFAIEVTSSFYHFSSRFWKCFFVAVVGTYTSCFHILNLLFDRIYSIPDTHTIHFIVKFDLCRCVSRRQHHASFLFAFVLHVALQHLVRFAIVPLMGALALLRARRWLRRRRRSLGPHHVGECYFFHYVV